MHSSLFDKMLIEEITANITVSSYVIDKSEIKTFEDTFASTIDKEVGVSTITMRRSNSWNGPELCVKKICELH